MASLKAKKLNNAEIQKSQLATFVASLGIKHNIELYLCGEYVYINIDILLPVLLVDPVWFRKNAEIPTHYILIKKNVYINKYGMTKLLGQSQQPAAFMLQDYLYEIFYKVETDGTISRDSIVSRSKLIALAEEISTYKAIIEKNQDAVELAKEEAKSVMNDNSILELENNKLIEQITQLETDTVELNTEIDYYKNLASTLAKYVRVRAKKPPNEAYSESLDDLDDPDNDNEAELALITANALKAKKTLAGTLAAKAAKTKPIAKQTAKKVNIQTNIYFIMRSINVVDNDSNYHWSITNTKPTDDIIDISEEVMAGNLTYTEHQNICYRQVEFSEDKKNVTVLFLELINGVTDEITIEKLISL